MSRSYELTRLHAEMLVRSSLEVARCCERLGLECRDPPAAASALLRGLGYNQYRVRDLWRKLRTLEYISLEVYVASNVRFELRLYYSEGPLRETQCGELRVPVDEIDSSRVDYEYAPRANRAFIYIEGEYSNVGIKINVERLLTLLARSNPEILESLAESLLALIWGQKRKVTEVVLEMMSRWSTTLSLVLPLVPTTVEDLLRVSPLLRRVLAD